MNTAPAASQSIGDSASTTVTLRVANDASGNPYLTAEPQGGTIDVSGRNVVLTFKLVDGTGRGWVFPDHKSNEAKEDNYYGIEIVGDDRQQFRDVHLSDDRLTVTFKDNDSNTSPRPYSYCVTVVNGVDTPLRLDPTINNQGR